MKLHPISLAFLALCSWNCVGQVISHRHSGDFSQHFLYFSTNVAISKVTQTEAFGETKTYYHLGKAHWAGEPELARFTGDIFDKDLEPNPTKMGISGDGKWLVAEGQKFSEVKHQYVKQTQVVSLDSGKYWVINNTEPTDELSKLVNWRSIRTEPVTVFFDRMLITYLTSNSK